jgi:tRNA-dihydrouridine synthase A
LELFKPYVAAQLEKGVRLHSMTKHLLGLFPGRRGARLYRRYLSTEGLRQGAGLAEYDAAIALVREAVEPSFDDLRANSDLIASGGML